MPKGRGSKRLRNRKQINPREKKEPMGGIARLLKGAYRRGKGTMHISEIEMRKG